MRNQILIGDCIQVMLQEKPKADLIFTSPPYPGQKGNEQSVNDWLAWFTHFLVASERGGLSDNGVICVNVTFKRAAEGWYDCSLLGIPTLLRRYGFNIIDTYIWTKPNPAPNGPLTYCDAPAWEPVFVATRAKSPGDYTFRPYRKPYKPKSIARNGTIYSTRNANGARPHPDGARQPNVVKASSSGDQGRPKAAGQSFPLELAERFILQYSNPGDLVLDPFAGVGTTCKAAQRNGRDWLGIEIKESEAEKAREWLAEPYQCRLETFIL